MGNPTILVQFINISLVLFMYTIRCASEHQSGVWGSKVIMSSNSISYILICVPEIPLIVTLICVHGTHHIVHTPWLVQVFKHTYIIFSCYSRPTHNYHMWKWGLTKSLVCPWLVTISSNRTIAYFWLLKGRFISNFIACCRFPMSLTSFPKYTWVGLCGSIGHSYVLIGVQKSHCFPHIYISAMHKPQ